MELFYSVLRLKYITIIRIFEYTSKYSDEHTALVIVCVCMYVCLFTTRFIYILDYIKQTSYFLDLLYKLHLEQINISSCNVQLFDDDL